MLVIYLALVIALSMERTSGLSVDLGGTEIGQPWVMDNGDVYRDTVTMQWSRDVAQFAADHQRQQDDQVSQRRALIARVNRSRPESPATFPTFFSRTLNAPVGRTYNVRNLDYGITPRLRSPLAEHSQHRARADREEAKILTQRRQEENAINSNNNNINEDLVVKERRVNTGKTRERFSSRLSTFAPQPLLGVAQVARRLPARRTLYKLRVAIPATSTASRSVGPSLANSQSVRNAHLLSAFDRNAALLTSHYFSFFKR